MAVGLASSAAVSGRSQHAFRRPSALPGFPLAFGYAVTYLCLIVLLPLAALVWHASAAGLAGLWAIASEERTLCELFGESYRAYARQVGRFMPGWRQLARGGPGVPRRGVFCWRQVLANDEHVTVLFTLTMTVLFALRMTW